MQMLSARVALLRLPTGLRAGAGPLSVRYPARCAAAAPDRLPPPDVQKLAKLAHIAVTEEEAALWGPQIGEIVQWFDQLQAVDIEGVPPALRAGVEGAHQLREDVPRVYENREALMAEVPEKEGVFVKVPKMTGGQTE